MQELRLSLWEERLAEKKSNGRFTFWACFLVLLIALVLVLNTMVFFMVEVDGASMQNTLYDGDVLTVNKLRQPREGDIVILEMADGSYIIKRVIATEGDSVEIKNGKVYLNESQTPISEPYAKGETYPTGASTRWIVGEDEVFFLGDNRQNSLDSRVLGAFKIEKVLGVVEDWSIKTTGIRTWIYNTIGI